MNETVRAHLRKAHERLEDAGALFAQGRYSGTVNRTYYAMFESASAMLADIGMRFESHQGVVRKFGEMFAKTRKVEPEYGRTLAQAFDLRQDADYALDARAEISRETAEAELRKAREFVAMAESMLNPSD